MSMFVTKAGRKVNVRPDTMDFRDQMFIPTLVEVPTKIELKDYKNWQVPILDQGTEGACTGFGLATMVHYLMRKRKVVPDTTTISPHMLYQLAKRYDEWPGDNYEGSSARGAMKGWHKHGVCADSIWKKEKRLAPNASTDAATRPLGAYFRVNHRDLVAMHSAIVEVGILYASATVHAGWDNVKADGIIKMQDQILGGHAFAIVAFDEHGFWIQNSWGQKWGNEGLARISYDDWLANGSDVWVARLGVPVHIQAAESVAARNSAATSYTDAFSNYELRRHIISIGNDGLLSPGGTYGTSKKDVEDIFKVHFQSTTNNWKKKRILLYAHGGLVDEASAVQRLADYRSAMLDAEVYPISFIWHSDFWTTFTNILKEAVRLRRPEGILDATKNFMLDRLDDALEPLARQLGGKGQWDEMKENALGATNSRNGGARIALEYLNQLLTDNPDIEVHVVGHSAGSIFHAPLIKLLTGQYNRKITTCTLWAPACTIELFKAHYLPAINNQKIGRFALFTMTDKSEQDDNCAKIYNKSLLYLVSNSFEKEARIPLFRDGVSLLGMEKFVAKDPEIRQLLKTKKADWIVSPNNNESADTVKYSTARHHGDFDDDEPTVKATLARILDKHETGVSFSFNRSAASLREGRDRLYEGGKKG